MEKQRKNHKEQKKCLRLLLFPLPFQGHLSPMLQLANILYSKGFSITIIHTCFNSPKPSNYPHFTFHSIPDGLSKSSCRADDMVAIVSLLKANCVEPFRDYLAKLLYDNDNSVQEEPVACLISDSSWSFTGVIAESMKLPILLLRTINVSSFLVLASLPLLHQKGYLPIQESQVEAPVIELPPLKVLDIPVFQTEDQVSIHQTISGLVKQTKSCSGVIWNTFEDLESGSVTAFWHDFLVPAFPIGPLHKYFPSSSSSLMSQDQTSITWLDKQAPKSVIYVSFGSVVSIEKGEFVEIAWGLANSQQPFLLVVRPGSVCGSEWLEFLPNESLEEISDRGHIVKWAPQQEVLAHPAIGGFWTHCGWNSILESICEGVPMICQPCFGDQKVNARYVSDVWKIGVHLENGVDRLNIAKAVKKLFAEVEGQGMRERVVHLQKMADQCIKQEGSSYHSLESLISLILSFQSDRKQSLN